MEFILNGQAHGDLATKLLAANGDHGALRPFVANDGKSYITLNEGGQQKNFVVNSPATLRYDDWRLIDTAVVKAAKPRLRFVNDIRGAGLTFNIANGLAKTVLSTETQNDITGARISMDGLARSDNDRPEYAMQNLPLPIISKDFSLSLRQLLVSRNSGTPLDTTMMELAGRKVAEEAEKLALGVSGSYSFGGGTVYGLLNFPNRLTKTLTSPVAGGWTPATTVKEVLDMKAKSQAAFHFGPWKLYVSPAWDQYLDDDYSSAKGDNTLRERIKAIDSIQDVVTLDYLTGYTMVLVQMTSDVIRIVNGLDITTVQWASQGGMELNFKVLAMMVPQLRADANTNTGIVHGAPAA